MQNWELEERIQALEGDLKSQREGEAGQQRALRALEAKLAESEKERIALVAAAGQVNERIPMVLAATESEGRDVRLQRDESNREKNASR